MIEHKIYPEIIEDCRYAEEILLIEEYLKRNCTEGSIMSKDGLMLSYAYIKTEKAKGNIVIVHGYSEFYKKYSEMCYYYHLAGYNVFMYDQRGHGLFGREVDDISVCHVNSFDEYVSDLEEFIDRVVVPCANGTSINIFAHSMGGTVTLMYLMKRSDIIKKAVLSSPMIKPGTKGMPEPMLRNLVKKDGEKYGFESKFRYAVSFDPNQKCKEVKTTSIERFTHNLELRRMNKEYQNSSSTNRWMYESLTVYKNLFDKELLSRIKSKCLIINAGKDEVVRHAPQKKLARISGFEYVSVADVKHSIYVSRSEILKKYYKIIFDFLEE